MAEVPQVVELDTPHGPARAHVRRPRGALGALVLGHGAGGGVGAPDLQAAARAAEALRLAVALVEQPYRVAGRRSPAPAAQLDAAWLAVVEQLRRRELRRLPLVVGGRSSGARVACRTASAARAAAVLCLAFPVHPPGRPDAPDRLAELDAVTVPTLVVQGERDPFGRPPPGPAREVVLVPGDHSLRAAAEVQAAVAAWLPRAVP
ncbi:MAG TPA: alpha/beta family hydrolase [Gaiellaceae bacterium]|nr:alpha/beta family hydrolase [Gaiellaceae bacterium]